MPTGVVVEADNRHNLVATYMHVTYLGCIRLPILVTVFFILIAVIISFIPLLEENDDH